MTGLIIDDRERRIFPYRRSAMTSPAILKQEKQRIFDKCWLYLCHESEVEQPGDYQRRTVGGRPMFVVRGADGQQRAFLNTCSHRGALICRQDQDNAEVFQCFYHAWSYNNRGELIGIPDEAGYPDSFKKVEMGLKQSPRVESYRGLCFVNFDPAAEDLYHYLGGAREYIDAMMDQSEDGMRILPGCNKYDIQAYWKLLIKNSIDGYHGQPTHKTFFDYVRSLWPEALSGIYGDARSLGKGHTVIEYPAAAGKPIAVWTPQFPPESRDEMVKVRARLVERFGEEYASRMADKQRNLFVFPNLILNDVAALTVRYFEPISPDLMRVNAWALAPPKKKTRSCWPHAWLTSLAFLVLEGWPPPTTQKPWNHARLVSRLPESSALTSPEECIATPGLSTRYKCAGSGASGTPTSWGSQNAIPATAHPPIELLPWPHRHLIEARRHRSGSLGNTLAGR